jgi:hypothetical protein
MALGVVATIVVCAGLVVLTQVPRSERVELQSNWFTAHMGKDARQTLLPTQMRVSPPSSTQILSQPWTSLP